MVDYYLDPVASGVDDGTSWDDAWTTMQRAHDGTDGTAPTSGDIVYCRGTEILTTHVNYNAASGSQLDYLRWVGCNSGGTVDGTRYVLDADTNACHGIRWTGSKLSYVSIENFEITTSNGGTYIGISHDGGSDTYGTRLINCYIHNWQSAGVFLGSFGSNYGFGWTIIGCKMSGNLGDGLSGGENLTVVGSTFNGNGSSGAEHMQSSVFYNCLFYKNLGAGVSDDLTNHYVNCVFDANNYGADVQGYGVSSSLIGCRITNNSNGIRSPNGICNLFGCYVGGNIANDFIGDYSAIDLDGDSTWNELDGSDTDEGYVDSASNNYNLAKDATGYSKALELQ